jgi:hypothetical protein
MQNFGIQFSPYTMWYLGGQSCGFKKKFPYGSETLLKTYEGLGDIFDCDFEDKCTE